MMDPMVLALAAVVLLVLLALIGMPLAFSSAFVGLAGMIVLRGFSPSGGLVGGLPWSIAHNYSMIVIPAFIMMGYFASYGNITTALYELARRWVGHLAGGLGIATLLGTALWSAISGSSTATTVVMGRLAVPEMLKFGYDRRLATGLVAAAAGMDALIPPSSTLVIYGIFTDTSIGRLLIAGFIPGFLEAITLSIFIYIIAKRNPAIAPPGPRATWGERWSALFIAGNWVFIIIFLVVFGGIYVGLFTATEAASIGAVLTFVAALAMRRLTSANFSECLMESAKITVALFAILAGIFLLMHFLAYTGFQRLVTEAIVSLPVSPMVILVGFLFILLILGCFMEAIGMMALTLPLFHPIAESLGIDSVWLGILVVKMIEIGLITPPVGMNVYVMKATMPEVPTADIFRGAAPFLFIQCVNVGLILVFPQIALWLPSLMLR